MSPRRWAAVSFALGGLALLASYYERRSAGALAHYADDTAELGALVDARAALDLGVLESRAGIQLNFDNVNRAARSLRAALLDGQTVRSRGPEYAEAADALERLAEESRSQESSLESLKTDLALLRLSSRYFPSAAESVFHGGEANARHWQALRAALGRYDAAPAPELARQLDAELADLGSSLARLDALAAQVGSLRGDVERYEEVPTREIAQRLQNEISALDGLRESLPEASRPDLDVLLGHARAILERRERVDRSVRAIVRSTAGADAQTAMAAYERAARHEFRAALVLRIVSAELLVGALAVFAAAAWKALRRD